MEQETYVDECDICANRREDLDDSDADYFGCTAVKQDDIFKLFLLGEKCSKFEKGNK